MTAIWDRDRLGGNASTLAYQKDKWNDAIALKVLNCMRAVYMCIKDRPEYQNLTVFLESDLRTLETKPKLLEVLRQAVEPTTPTPQIMSVLAGCASRLHDFDHMSTPTEFGPSYGHHTEVIIVRKRANRQYARLLNNLHNDSWWRGDYDDKEGSSEEGATK